MRDKRTVDELTVDELERILAIKKRQDRQQKLQRMERAGRLLNPEAQSAPLPSPIPLAESAVSQPASILPPELERVVNPPPAPRVREVAPRFEDDSPDHPRRNPERSRFWRSFVNQTTLLVEVLAVIGLLYLGYQMLTATTLLQRETANAQALADQQRRDNLPTLAPTPQIRLSQVVLPGGHIFVGGGEAQFNFNEIPEALRSQVAAEIFQPISVRPPRTPETALALSIPTLNVDQTIVQGVDLEALKLGIGQVLNGTQPGDPQGNIVLAGHNDIYGEYFRYLDKLAVGDEFFVRTETQVYSYRVTGTQIVSPNDVQVMNPRDGATATLISCYPYQKNDKRIIVFADRVG